MISLDDTEKGKARHYFRTGHDGTNLTYSQMIYTLEA